jgi:hypothetical protein
MKWRCFGSALCVDLGDSSRHQKSCSKVRFRETHEMMIAALPGAGGKVRGKRGNGAPLGFDADACPKGRPAAHRLLKVRLRSTPVRVEEAVDAIPGDGHGRHVGPDRSSASREGWTTTPERNVFGHVVANEPESRNQEIVPLEDHDPSRDTAHLE